MTIIFRPAQIRDVPAIIPLLHSSDALVFEYIYTQNNHTAQDFLSFALKHNKGSFGIGQQIVGTFEEKVVFSGTVLKGGESFWRLMHQNAETSLIFFALNQNPRGILKAEPFKDLMFPPSNESLFIQNLGTNPKYRGQGICTAFLKLQHDLARKQHLTSCELDVGIDNPRAEQLYTRLGYQVIEEILLPSNEIIPGIKRMKLKL